MTTTLRNDGAPTRTRAELLAFIETLIGAGPWPVVSADDLREVREALQLREQRATDCAYAVKDAAIAYARGPSIGLMRRQGHDETADAYEAAAQRVARLDVDAIVASVTGQGPSVEQHAAFEAAAKAADFNTTRRDNGELFHPVTKRVQTIWNAAVRWSRASAGAQSTTQSQP